MTHRLSIKRYHKAKWMIFRVRRESNMKLYVRDVKNQVLDHD